jgi:hypothetical protein
MGRSCSRCVAEAAAQNAGWAGTVMEQHQEVKEQVGWMDRGVEMQPHVQQKQGLGRGK